MGARTGGSGARVVREVELYDIFDNEDHAEVKVVGCGVSPGTNVRETSEQTDLPFQDHTKPCAVSTVPRDAIAVGFYTLAADTVSARQSGFSGAA